MKTTTIAASIAFSLAMTCIAGNPVINCVHKKNADWNDASAWNSGEVPSQENEVAIMNGGSSAVVDNPFEAPIHVQVGNGVSKAPDGTLTINADFQVTSISLASVTGTPCIVEQNAGNVSLKDLSLASMSPDSIEATYDLKGGKLETDTLNVGLMGPGNLNLKGTGEVVTVRRKLAIGSQAALHFTGGKPGFPTVNAGAEVTIQPGAALTVEAGGPGTKPGKFTLIQADQPLAGSFKVELAGFAAGKAKLLESEPGIVLEVK